jgi:hypothetical protein
MLVCRSNSGLERSRESASMKKSGFTEERRLWVAWSQSAYQLSAAGPVGSVGLPDRRCCTRRTGPTGCLEATTERAGRSPDRLRVPTPARAAAGRRLADQRQAGLPAVCGGGVGTSSEEAEAASRGWCRAVSPRPRSSRSHGLTGHHAGWLNYSHREPETP